MIGNLSNGDIWVGEQRPCNVEVVIQQFGRAASRSAHALRRRKSRSGALSNEGALEFRQSAEQVEYQNTLRGSRIDRLGEAPKPDAS
jgi:hypothetical protein